MEDEQKLHSHFGRMRGIPRVIAIAMVTVLAALSSRAMAGDMHEALPPAAFQARSGDSDFLADGSAVLDFFRKAFDTSEFLPRWQSETWTAAHAWLHIASDLVIASAYLLMATVLAHAYRSRAPYARLFLLFAFFVFAGGITHLLDALMFWWPAYRLTALQGGRRADFSCDSRVAGSNSPESHSAPQSCGDTTRNHPAAQNRTRAAAGPRPARRRH
jgi:hypothetical protein